MLPLSASQRSLKELKDLHSFSSFKLSLSAWGKNIHTYKNKLDNLMSFDCIKVILKYCFSKNEISKNEKKFSYGKNRRGGAFGSVVRCVTDGITRTHIF